MSAETTVCVSLRSRLVRHRTAVINQIRALLLERGIAVRQGVRFLRAALPDILGRHSELLSPRMVQVIAELSGDLRHLNERLDEVTTEIETLAKADDACQRLMTVPGIGPIIASAMVSAIGDGAAFGKGRDFAAWLGLVPRQMSTGGRTILGRISKRGSGLGLRVLVPVVRSAGWMADLRIMSRWRPGVGGVPKAEPCLPL